MKHFKNYLRRFAKDESGEVYIGNSIIVIVMIVGLIAVAIKIKNVISCGL